LFAGASLDGTVVEHDEGEAKKLYGKAMSNRDIIEGHVATPEAARVLVHELDEIAPIRKR